MTTDGRAVEVARADLSGELLEAVHVDGGGERRPLELVSTLCRALDRARIDYCHWKSNEALDRSATGENDLDLLVSRSHAQRFEEILRRLGFKDAQPPPWKAIPGIYHSYGLDRPTGRLVHIHAHYQLVVGDDMTKSYRLPIEAAYLASVVPAPPFKIPAPELEFAVFLVRMVLKHCPWDSILSLQGSLTPSERRELADLGARVEPERVWTIMRVHLPFLPRELWERCLRSVRPGSSIPFRARTARLLQRRLAASSRRPMVVDTYLKIWRRARTVLRRKVFRRGPITRRLNDGGVLIAIVGGDGAGKSTVVRDLSEWLAGELSVATVHLGKPRWSPLSVVLKRLMRVASSVGRSPSPSPSALRTSLSGPNVGSMSLRALARLSWVVLTARDRYHAYRGARRRATNGAIVLCDRYPLREIELMDGAVTAHLADAARRNRLVAYLADRERRYYDRITRPDVLIVLRVDPDVAVGRRPGVDDESILRPRSEEVWRMDWRDVPAVVIDAGRPKADVLAEVRSVVWSRL